MWDIEEHAHQLLRSTATSRFGGAWAELEHAVKATRVPEAKSPFATLRAGHGPC